MLRCDCRTICARIPPQPEEVAPRAAARTRNVKDNQPHHGRFSLTEQLHHLESPALTVHSPRETKEYRACMYCSRNDCPGLTIIVNDFIF
jgi:hypothetical protein